MEKFSAWICALKQQKTNWSTETPPKNLYTEALTLSIQHSKTIDDLFDPNSARRKMLAPVYKALDITLETDASRHMSKAFNVLNMPNTRISYDCLSILEKIISDQIKVHRNKISAETLIQNSRLQHNYSAIPTTEKTCDDKNKGTVQSCAELFNNCFKAVFG
ncbi:MAG: hypothetical protein NXI01_05925 [Gammaproteobacteria bacterium]|nr:hypothetical protein [Gammaproteobacteria bacterium]